MPFDALRSVFRSMRIHLKEVVGMRGPSELTLEDFRLELAELGLLGRGLLLRGRGQR